MVAKAFFVFCASALLFQSITASCIGYNPCASARAGPAPLIAAGAGRPWAGGCGGLGAVASGGGLAVSSASALAPTGLTMVSENTMEGPFEVVGQLPVLSAVTLEGQIPTGGSAGTAYSCGNGDVGIFADSLAAAGIESADAGLVGAGLNGIGAGLNGIGAGIANSGLINPGFANAGLAAAGLNAGLAGARLARPGCGGIY